MKKLGQRLVSAALAGCMMLSVLPVHTFAASTVGGGGIIEDLRLTSAGYPYQKDAQNPMDKTAATGTGWAYVFDDDFIGTLTIAENYTLYLNEELQPVFGNKEIQPSIVLNGTIKGDDTIKPVSTVTIQSTGTILNGTFGNVSTVVNNGAIVNGHFWGIVNNNNSITGGKFGESVNATCTVKNNVDGIISGGWFYEGLHHVVNGGRIKDANTLETSPVFWCDVQNGEQSGGAAESSAPITDRPVVFAAENGVEQATIDGGTFAGEVTNYALITGGVFKNAINNQNGTIEPEAQKLTVLNADVKINDVFDQSANAPTYVVNNKTVSVACASSAFAGKRWKITNQKTNAVTYSTQNPAEIPMPGDADVTLEMVDETQPDPVTPGEDDGEKNVKLNVDSNAVALDENGNAASTAKPGQKITLKLAEGKEKQGDLVFSQWIIQANGKTLTPDELPGFEPGKTETSFALPADWPADAALDIAPSYADPEQAQDDDLLSTAAAVAGSAALTGLVAWNGYNIFAEVYMKQVWPVLPENRVELALSLWHDADAPAAADTTLYTDLEADDADAQTAARWAVENELLKPADRDDETVFKPYQAVTPGQVYRAWKKLQK